MKLNSTFNRERKIHIERVWLKYRSGNATIETYVHIMMIKKDFFHFIALFGGERKKSNFPNQFGNFMTKKLKR